MRMFIYKARMAYLLIGQLGIIAGIATAILAIIGLNGLYLYPTLAISCFSLIYLYMAPADLMHFVPAITPRTLKKIWAKGGLPHLTQNDLNKFIKGDGPIVLKAGLMQRLEELQNDKDERQPGKDNRPGELSGDEQCVDSTPSNEKENESQGQAPGESVSLDEELKGTHEGVDLKRVFEKDMELRVPYYHEESKSFFMKVDESHSVFLGVQKANDYPDGLVYDVTKGSISVQRVVKSRFFDMIASVGNLPQSKS